MHVQLTVDFTIGREVNKFIGKLRGPICCDSTLERRREQMTLDTENKFAQFPRVGHYIRLNLINQKETLHAW